MQQSRTCEGDGKLFYTVDVNTNVAGFITDCTGEFDAGNNRWKTTFPFNSNPTIAAGTWTITEKTHSTPHRGG